MNSWDNMQNILCVRLDNMGDLLMTTPAIRAVKESGRNRKITLLTSSSAAHIAEYIPEIDQLLVFDAPWVKNEATAYSLDAIISTLKKYKFDGAIIFTVYSQSAAPSAMLCLQAGIPRRLAYSHENLYCLLTDWVADIEPEKIIRHEVERQLHLVAQIGAYTKNKRISIAVPQHAKEKLAKVFEASNISLEKPIIVVHPGSSSLSRMYPIQKFTQIVHILKNKYPYSQIVITGTNREKAFIKMLKQGKNVYSLIDKLSIDVFSALIEKASLLIANNTGPVHIAASVGTPVVDLYALTNPQHAPWMVKHKVLYFPVKERKSYYTSSIPISDCVEKLKDPRHVVKAVEELFSYEKIN